jgi:cell division protease FtsH
MVTQYGFSSTLGAVSFGGGGEVFIGRDMAQAREYSEVTAQQIDSEVRAILEGAHNEAYKAINQNRAVLDAMAKELMEKETLNPDDIARIFKTVKKLPKRAQWLSSKSRPVSKIAPIAIPVKGSSAAKASARKAAETKAAATAKKAPVAKKASPKKPAAPSKPAAPKDSSSKNKA